jgi:hypothetical protein
LFVSRGFGLEIRLGIFLGSAEIRPDLGLFKKLCKKAQRKEPVKKARENHIESPVPS